MSKKFNALVIDNQNEKFSREIKELSTDSLKDGNVLVKIDYSSLNYKDAMILNNGGKIVKKYPFGKATLAIAVPDAWIDVQTIADLEEIAFEFKDLKKKKIKSQF